MKVYAKASTIRFVYPFAIRRSDFAESVTRVAAQRWGDGTGTLWQDQELDGADFLPHLARYFQSSATPPMGRLWRLDDGARQHQDGLAANFLWSLQLPGGGGGRRPPLRFSIDAVELAVFAVGVAFVTTTVSARAAEGRDRSEDLDDWLDLLHYFRFAANRRA